MTRPNGTPRHIVTLIPARPFDRLSQTGSVVTKSLASSFFWLYGPASAGKTAIFHAFAEFLRSPSESGQNLGGGSFFFSRGKQGSRSRPFSVLNDRLSTRSESTWTTSTRRLYFSYKPLSSRSKIYRPVLSFFYHAMTRRPKNRFSDYCPKRSQFINYRSDY